MNQSTSASIALLRFPLACMVVFLHAISGDIMADIENLDYLNLTGWDACSLLEISLSHVITHVAVPVFFIISGFLFFQKLDRWDWAIWKDKMRRRYKSLFLPYILWCSIFVLFVLGKKILGVIVHGKSLSGIVIWLSSKNYLHLLWDCSSFGEGRTSWFGYIIPHTTTPLLFPFWFIRDLMVIVLLAPVIWLFLKSLGKTWIVFMVFLYVSGTWIDIHGLGLSAVFFFSWGGYFGVKRKDMIESFFRYRFLVYPAFAFLFLFTTAYDGINTYTGNIFYPFFNIVGMIVTLCLSLEVYRKWRLEPNEFLAGSCFFIFASHAFILSYCNSFLTSFIGNYNPVVTIVVYLLTPTITIALCLLFYSFVRKYLSNYSYLLTGGR